MAEPLVGIIMGSSSDWETMRHAADTLEQLDVPCETKVVSAHRTPKRLYDYAHSAKDRGLKVVIAYTGTYRDAGNGTRQIAGAGGHVQQRAYEPILQFVTSWPVSEDSSTSGPRIAALSESASTLTCTEAATTFAFERIVRAVAEPPVNATRSPGPT